MKPYPILEVAFALISALGASTLAFFVVAIFGYAAIMMLGGLILLCGVLGLVCLALRSPLGWVCFGFPFSSLIGLVAGQAWSHPQQFIDWPILIIGCLGFASVYRGTFVAIHDSRRMRLNLERGKPKSTHQGLDD